MSKGRNSRDSQPRIDPSLTMPNDHGFLAALRWAVTRRAHRWPRTVPQKVLDSVPARSAADQISWVLVGHSTVLLQAWGVNVLFDPIWSDRCSPIAWAGPRRVRPPALAFEGLPPIDIVLISHNHYDHCDRPTLQRLAAEHGACFVTGRGVAQHLRGWGIEQVQELDWWESAERTVARNGETAGIPLRIDFVPSKHFSARGLGDRNKTLWGGFWLSTNVAAEGIYFCGDTGWDRALFVELEDRMGSPDLAFLPIGAYSPRWFMAPVHVDPEEAVQIHRVLGSRRSVAMHCATFQLTDEPIDEPQRRLLTAARKAGLAKTEFGLPAFGVRETLEGCKAS